MAHLDTPGYERDAARLYRALTADWRKWEADHRHRPVLVRALTEAQAQLTAWEVEAPGRLALTHQGRLLRDQVRNVEAFIEQYDHEKARGY